MRKLPTLVAGAFLAIQLQRVADFVSKGLNGGPVLGWAFALGIAAGVFVSAYWTRQSITRKDGEEDKRDRQARSAAWWSLVIFISLDGAFNLAETLRVLIDQGLRVYAVIYGVSPTVAAAVLGSMQGRIDRLPVAPRKSRTGSVLDAVALWLERVFAVDNPVEAPAATAQPAQAARIPVEATAIRYCDVPGCGWSTASCEPAVRDNPERSQRALAGHKRNHSRNAIKSIPVIPALTEVKS